MIESTVSSEASLMLVYIKEINKMPLYEVIMRCRIGSLSRLVVLYQELMTAVTSYSGVVRTAEFMGDRALQRTYRTTDGRLHGIGRYIRVSKLASKLIQIEMDLNPEAKAKVESMLKQNDEVMNSWMFVVKNKIYAARAFNRAAAQLGPTYETEDVD